MNCTQYQELLIEKLYDEIEADGELKLDAHLEQCDSCKDQLDRLGRTRDFLAENPIDAPRVTPSVIVAKPHRKLNPWLAFAAGLLIATALVATGVGIGLAVQDGPVVANHQPQDTQPIGSDELVTSAELESLLNQYRNDFENRLHSVGNQLEKMNTTPVNHGSIPQNGYSREELDSRLRQLAARINTQGSPDESQLEQDLASLINWRTATDQELEEMKRVLLWVVASQDPRLAEQ